MAARFPQSSTSVAYQIKPAYSAKVLAIYWAATADSVHRLYSSDTATTIITRSASGAGFNATDGRITGNFGTSVFTDSKTGGLGTTEDGSLTYIASYYGDLFNGVSDTWFIGCNAPMDTFNNKQSIRVDSAYTVNFVRSGNGIGTNSAGGADNVAAYTVVGLRHVAADPTARYRAWANGAELTGVRSTSAPSSTAIVGDSSNALRFGGTALGTGNTKLEGECWIVATNLSDAEMDAITADPSIVIEASPTAVLSSSFTLDDLTLSGTFATGALSQLAGSIALDDFVNGGFLGLAPGRVDTAPFKNWSGTLLPGVTVANVVFLKLDRTLPLALTNQVTAGDGAMTIQNAALVTGTYYVMVCFDATGANIGAELVLAT